MVKWSTSTKMTSLPCERLFALSCSCMFNKDLGDVQFKTYLDTIDIYERFFLCTFRRAAKRQICSREHGQAILK